MSKKIQQILRERSQRLEDSGKDLKTIFEVMFSDPDEILCETNDGFRIQTQTYGQMRNRIEQAAAALYAKIGATHRYIALEMENCPDWIVAFWAILKSGNKPYLVNTRYPQSLTEGILRTLEIQIILCAEGTQLPGTAISISQLTGTYDAVPEDVFENELAFSSSATSMNEVICFYTGAQVAAQILNFKAIVREAPRMTRHYKGRLKQLAFLPFYHVFGLFAVYFWFTFFGRTLVFLRDYSAETILKTCRRHQVTHIFAVPMLWHTVEKQLRSQVAKQGEKKEKQLQKILRFTTAFQNIFPYAGAALAKKLLGQVTDKLFGRSVIFCINGGSYLRDSAMELLNGLGYSMHNGYGMSEIGITSVELRHRPKHRNRNSIGHPFSCIQYRLDEDGILQVKGGTLCVKKLVNGQPVTLDEWFDTGDLMHCEDGHYYIRGRRSDTVIGENGENINPDMVEKVFLPQLVQQFSVLGMPGENGQELALVAQIPDYTTAAMAGRLKEYFYSVNNTLPAAMAVKNFYVTFDQIAPPTAVKVSRKQLLQKIADGQVHLTNIRQFQPENSDSGCSSALLAPVCRIIAQVLEVEESQVTAECHIFYDLGASSIQYFSILSALAQHFEISEYSSTDTYCYTPKEICEYIERKL